VELEQQLLQEVLGSVQVVVRVFQILHKHCQ
jgi:hypothetical protein